MTIQTLNKPLGFLTNAKCFVAFARTWWDGAGHDSVSWWIDGAGGHEKVLMTGEVRTKTDPLAVFEDEIDKARIRALIVEFDSLGMRRLTSQSERLILSHYDDTFGIKVDESSTPHWITIAGGMHIDPLAEKLLDRVYELCPQLLESLTVPELGDEIE